MSNRFSPFLVVGTGRSGTSFVADVLHNDLKIKMGEVFIPADLANSEGYWEDCDFYKLNKQFVFGIIDYLTWRGRVLALLEKRRAEKVMWGFKESRMSHLLGLYLSFLEAPKVIYCTRDFDLCVKSLQRCYKFNKASATDFVVRRKTQIDNVLQGRDFLRIHFGCRRKSRSEVAEQITKKWETKYAGCC